MVRLFATRRAASTEWGVDLPMMAKLGYFARETLISLRRNLLMTLAGILTVTVSLFLFGGIMLLSRVIDHGTRT